MSDNFAFSLLSSTKPLCRDAISLACARICVRSKSSDEDVDCWPPRFENIFDDVMIFKFCCVVNVLSLNSQRSLSLVGVGGARSNTTNETETIDFSLFLFFSLRSCCCYV